MKGEVRRWLLRATVVLLAACVGLVAWLSERDAEQAADGEAFHKVRIVRPAELGDAAVLSGHPVYWLGPVPGTELGLSEGADGTVQVRYLEADVDPRDAPANVLTVGSYPIPDPAKALAAFAARRGSTVSDAGDGTKVVTSTESPGSAYFASPGNSVEVEVYAPAPKRALHLVLAGQVRPAG